MYPVGLLTSTRSRDVAVEETVSDIGSCAGGVSGDASGLVSCRVDESSGNSTRCDASNSGTSHSVDGSGNSQLGDGGYKNVCGLFLVAASSATCTSIVLGRGKGCILWAASAGECAATSGRVEYDATDGTLSDLESRTVTSEVSDGGEACFL